MNRPMDDLPERLIESDATAFERRVLGAALQKQPSRAASARMAKALGVTVAAVGTATAASTLAADVAVTKATATVATTSLWPWISAGVIGLVVAGAVVGTRARHAPEPHRAPAVTAPLPPAPAPVEAEPAAVVAEPLPRAVARLSAAAPVTSATRSPSSIQRGRRCPREAAGTRWRSCAATWTNTRPAVSVPKRSRSRSRR